MLVESKSKVVASDKLTAPDPPNNNVAVPSVNVKSSTDVNVISVAFKLSAVASELPIVTVLWPLLPILIL